MGLSLMKILEPHLSHWSPMAEVFLRGSLHLAHLYICQRPHSAAGAASSEGAGAAWASAAFAALAATRASVVFLVLGL